MVFLETHPLLNLDFARTNRKELCSTFDVVFRLVLHEHRPAHDHEFFDNVAVGENFL